jgi:hypothetical protein
MTLTANEEAVLDNVLKNHFVSARWKWNLDYRFNQDDFQVWCDCISDSDSEYQAPKGKVLSGTVSSLVKKGLLISDGECVILTEEGFRKAAKLPNYAELTVTPTCPELQDMCFGGTFPTD